MQDSDFDVIQKNVLQRMEGLGTNLTYHNTEHTLDVLKQSLRIAFDESINEKEIFFLKIAALYHDTGFLNVYAEHEKESCVIFMEDSGNFSLTDGSKKIITDLIMATKVPQMPKNLLQKIICDADLDYLGRHDFTGISGKLKEEFLNYSIIANEHEWHKLQLKFLDKHQYHTKSSQLLREPLKRVNYAGLLMEDKKNS